MDVCDSDNIKLYNYIMKTLNNVLKIKDQVIEIGSKTHDSVEKNRCRKKLKFLKNIILYLEYDPLESPIERQLRETVKKISLIESEFERAFPSGIDQKTKSKWMTSKGMSDIRKQQKILSYLLGGNE